MAETRATTKQRHDLFLPKGESRPMADHFVAWWNVENLFDVENSPLRSEKLNRQLRSELKGWDAADLTYSVAQGEFGKGSRESQAVRTGWSAVGIDAKERDSGDGRPKPPRPGDGDKKDSEPGKGGCLTTLVTLGLVR
jgi:hypothetical protein